MGIPPGSGGRRATLVLLVSGARAGAPADKAGIEEGNRLVSINGVSLRLSAADAKEGDMDGIVNRRLIRELEKVKAGADVDLRVWSGGEGEGGEGENGAGGGLRGRGGGAGHQRQGRPAGGPRPSRP